MVYLASGIVFVNSTKMAVTLVLVDQIEKFK